MCVGTYQCGMGGAGLGMATDATAAAENPALAVRMGNEAIVSAGILYANSTALINGTQYGNNTGAPRSSEAQVFMNASMGVNYRLSDDLAANISFFPGGGGASDWGMPRTGAGVGGGATDGTDHQMRWRMFELQAALAYAPVKNFAVGLGLVIIKADMKTDSLDNTFGRVSPGPLQTVDNAWGGGFQVGTVWDVNDALTVSADFHSRVWMERFRNYRNIFNGTVDRPPVIKIGADIKATENTIIAAKYSKIFNSTVQALGSQPAADGGFGRNDINVFAVGVQHQLNRVVTLRAGYNYGDSPIDEEHVFANVLLPAIVKHHWTAGATMKFSQAIEFGWSAFITPKASITDSGQGDAFSSSNQGTVLKQQQMGTQVSFKYDF